MLPMDITEYSSILMIVDVTSSSLRTDEQKVNNRQ